VNQWPKSVVREIRTPRSVGTGGGLAAPGDPVSEETGHWRHASVTAALIDATETAFASRFNAMIGGTAEAIVQIQSAQCVGL
jgi:hypothetical protein